MKQINESISENLQSIREAQQLSYDQLAELSGVSKSMLRQIETGRSNPTIATLWKIANGLKIPFTTLLRKQTHTVQVRSFKSEGPLHGLTSGYRLFPLTTFDPERPFETYYVEIDPEVQLEAEPHQGNPEEQVLVLQGKLNITIAGESHLVKAEEFITFQADLHHRYQNVGEEPVIAFMIISYLG